MVLEPAVMVRNRRFQFWKLSNRNRTAMVFHGFDFDSEQTVFGRFFTVLNRRFFAVSAWFHGFLAIFHGFDSKIFELEPNHGSKIDGFGLS